MLLVSGTLTTPGSEPQSPSQVLGLGCRADRELGATSPCAGTCSPRSVLLTPL